MVKIWPFYFFFLAIGCSSLYAQNVTIEAFINQNKGISNQPLTGTITITHPPKSNVDPDSFEIEDKPLQVQLIQNLSMPSERDPTMISVYQFELDPKSKGLYLLPPISVKVDKTTYQSVPSSYEVTEAIGIPQATPTKKATSVDINTAPVKAKAEKPPSIFKLESFFEGSTPLYPGQRAFFTYRIMYNQNVDLVNSDFPLLDTKDFIKIGDVKIKDYESQGLSIQDITQEIEALKPGHFHYEPATIEGYAYQINSIGEKVHFKNILQATAPAVDIIVEPFPVENQPASFNGAVGPNLSAQLTMLTPSTIKIGEKIELNLIVQGPSNLANMPLPHLSCQPGFSGFFHFNDFPPADRIEGSQKTFSIELRPISTLVSSIPSIELSAFNPATKTYLIWRSQPITLNVVASEDARPLSIYFPSSNEITTLIEKSNVPVNSIQNFQPVMIKAQELFVSWLDTFLVLFSIPLMAFLLLWQWKQHKGYN